MNVFELLKENKEKSNTEWILKSLLQNSCVTVVFKYKELAEDAKEKYCQSRNGIGFKESDDAPKFTSLERLSEYGILETMGRKIIFDNSCFL